MTRYILERLRWSLLVLAVVGVMAFLLTFVAPADPARSIAGPHATAAALARIRASLGLDRPMLDQLLDYAAHLVRGDLGTSYELGGVPVLDLVLGRMPATIELALAGLAVALAIGVPAGVVAAARPGGRADRAATLFGSVFMSVPAFLLAIVALYVFAYRLGFVSLVARPYDPLDIRSLLLPAAGIGLAASPSYLRITRSSMRDELHRDYTRTARAKGVSRRRETSHAFRNALPPVVTQAGLDAGFFLGGVVVIESVTGWPGIGQQAVRAVSTEDVPLLMGTLLVATLAIVLANLAADVLNAWLDPRIRDGLDGP